MRLAEAVEVVGGGCKRFTKRRRIMDTLISLLITLLIFGVVMYVVWWIIGIIPMPAPMKQIVQAVVAIIFLVVLLRYLLAYLPRPGMGPHHALWSTMCLGWKTKANCKARPAVNVTQPTGDTCPNISWFWLALAAIGIGTAMKGGK